jgi:hypothetical protein
MTSVAREEELLALVAEQERVLNTLSADDSVAAETPTLYIEADGSMRLEYRVTDAEGDLVALEVVPGPHFFRFPRLTKEQQATIVERNARGERQVDLAAEYAVSQSTVSRIVREGRK